MLPSLGKEFTYSLAYLLSDMFFVYGFILSFFFFYLGFSFFPSTLIVLSAEEIFEAS